MKKALMVLTAITSVITISAMAAEDIIVCPAPSSIHMKADGDRFAYYADENGYHFVQKFNFLKHKKPIGQIGEVAIYPLSNSYGQLACNYARATMWLSGNVTPVGSNWLPAQTGTYTCDTGGVNTICVATANTVN